MELYVYSGRVGYRPLIHLLAGFVLTLMMRATP